jgi:O-antigen/teichoic acid export membrane protein
VSTTKKAATVSLSMPVQEWQMESVRTRLIRGAFWSILGAALARGLSLAAAVFAGRMLGTVHFGELGMIQSTQGLFGVFAGAGLGLAATKHVAEFRATDAGRAGRCIILSIQIAALTGLAAMVCLFALSAWISREVLARPWLTLELQLASGLVLLSAISGVQTGALAGLERFRQIANVSVIRGVFLVAAMVAGVLWAGLLGAVIALLVAELAAVAANGFVLRRHCPTPTRGGTWREFAEVWRFSILAMLGSVATMPALWFANVVMVRQPHGYGALGVFNAAERWRQLLLFLPASLSATLLSLLSNLHGARDGSRYRKVVGVNLILTLTIVGLPALALMLFADPAMGVFGTDYRTGSLTLIILAGSAIVFVLNGLLGQILVSQGAIGLRLILDVFLALLLAGVSWWLVPVYGANGLALGRLVAYGAAAVALVIPAWYYLRRSRNQTAANLSLMTDAGGNG